MKRNFFILLALATSLSLLGADQLPEVTVTLKATNAQVGQVIFGCRKEARDAQDDPLDIPVPPMGMGAGVIGFKTPKKNFILYQDMRSCTLPQTWRLSYKPGRKPVILSWDRQLLPKELELELLLPPSRRLDMKARSQIVLSQGGIITITARPPQK